MSNIASRLRAAIEGWKQESGRDGSIRAFHKELARRGVRGSSYNMIHSYLRKENPREPSPTFLRGASALLGVREAWLTTGTGEPTEAEERIRRKRESSITEEDLLRNPKVDELFPGLDEFPLVIQDRFYEATDRYVRVADPDKIGLVRFWETLYGLLSAPSDLVPSPEFTPQAHEDYCVSVLQAVIQFLGGNSAFRRIMKDPDFDVSQGKETYLARMLKKHRAELMRGEANHPE